MLCAQLLRRMLHTAPQRLVRRRPNPGVDLQVHELEHEDELSQDPEGFGEVESDFMQVHRTHRQHEQQVQEERDKVRHIMIKHKYFRDQHLPNLLTYAEKEQIRLLHARDPTEWTTERLAESFPVTLDVVKKILNAKWRPRNAKRIRAHDEAVIQNWEELRSGKLSAQLPPMLLEHLQKFAARSKEDLQTLAASWEATSARVELPKPKRQEFLSIITSCSKYAETKPQQAHLAEGKVVSSTPMPSPADAEDESYLLDPVEDKRKMRIQEVKKFKLSPADLATLNKPLAATSETINNPFNTNVVANSTAPNPNPVPVAIAENSFVQKFESNEIVISVEDQKRFEMTTVKDRVHIPRKVWRRGATYRVRDCYYDDDGELLYRVPGMTV